MPDGAFSRATMSAKCQHSQKGCRLQPEAVRRPRAKEDALLAGSATYLLRQSILWGKLTQQRLRRSTSASATQKVRLHRPEQAPEGRTRLNQRFVDVCKTKGEPQGYTLLAVLLLHHLDPVSSETFPGLRRPPVNWVQQETDYLNHLFEEHARQRLQKQLEQQQRFYHKLHHQRGPNAQGEDYIQPMQPSFTYKFSENLGQSEDEETPFAVNPSDPRYYETSTNDFDISSSSYDGDRAKQHPYKTNVVGSAPEPKEEVPYYKPKPPMNVSPKLSFDGSFAHHGDLSALMEKLQRERQGGPGNRNEVVKKQVEVEGAVGMYVVALIAGISAAVTVGLIALAIGLYTLHRKTKAAADVEYPAYGVTGPNKDISPSGDRRLAQSAQMYHYQHQKQQIIAMENRTAGEHHGPMSDVESDDDNEEGDYTVYECPGLAPTGEMEVKNPLFLDDTPVTPSTNPTDQQPNQPQQQQSPQPQLQVQSPQKPAGKKQTKSSSSSPPGQGQEGNAKGKKGGVL